MLLKLSYNANMKKSIKSDIKVRKHPVNQSDQTGIGGTTSAKVGQMSYCGNEFSMLLKLSYSSSIKLIFEVVQEIKVRNVSVNQIRQE